MVLVGLAMFGIFFYNSLFLQNVLGYSAIETGATFLPMTVLIILVAPIAGRFSDRIGPRWLMGAGMTLLTVSLLLFGTLDENSTFWNDPARPARRRARNGDHDGPDDGGGDGLGARRQGRRRLGGDQQRCARSAARSASPIMGTLVATSVTVAQLNPAYAGPVRRGLPPRALRRRGDSCSAARSSRCSRFARRGSRSAMNWLAEEALEGIPIYEEAA